MEVVDSIPAIIDKDFIRYFKEPQIIPEEEPINNEEYEGEGTKTFQRLLFRDKDYIQLNRSANVLIYFFNEAIKEINDTDYTPNNENFKPNEKQTFILNLLKRFKDYVENYNKYSLQELKNRLNTLNNEFLRVLDEETRILLFRKCVSKIYKIRDKVLPKNQDFRKLFDTLYPTITDKEADELNNKTIKPIQKILDSIKVIQPVQPGLKPLTIKPDKGKAKPTKQTIPLQGQVRNFTYNKLDDKTVDLFKNSFVNNEIKIDDYCEIDKKNILEFRKTLDNYMGKLDEFNKAKTENEKSFIQGQIQHFKNELTKSYMELQTLNKYINFFLGVKRDRLKIERALELINYKFFDLDSMNDVFKLHDDSENLKELIQYAPIYNNYCDDFKKLSMAEQNHIKNTVFKTKTIFENDINDDFINNIKKDEIKAYIYYYLDDFKYIYSVLNQKDDVYSALKMDTNPKTVITKSGLIKKELGNISEDVDNEIKPYYLLSLYLQSLITELNLISDNSFVSTPFIEVYNNSINNVFQLVLRAFGLNDNSTFEDLMKYLNEKSDIVLKKYEEKQRELKGYFEDMKREVEENKEIDEALAEQDALEQEEERKTIERINKQLEDMTPINDIITKIKNRQPLTTEEEVRLKRFYEDKFEEMKQKTGYKQLKKQRKQEIREAFEKQRNELLQQLKELTQQPLPFGFEDDYEVGDPITYNGEGLLNNGVKNAIKGEMKGVKSALDGGAIFDAINGDYKDKINVIETIYKKLKEIMEDVLDVKLDTKMPDLTLLILNKDEEKPKEDNEINEPKKGGGKRGRKKGGVIFSEKKTTPYRLPFNPPQVSTQDTIEMIKTKKLLRNTRINNFNRTQIRNALNNVNNNAGLYDTLNQLQPDFLKNLAGNGTFLTNNLKSHINYIKSKCNGI